jgi:hypothetical protein
MLLSESAAFRRDIFVVIVSNKHSTTRL